MPVTNSTLSFIILTVGGLVAGIFPVLVAWYVRRLARPLLNYRSTAPRSGRIGATLFLNFAAFPVAACFALAPPVIGLYYLWRAISPNAMPDNADWLLLISWNLSFWPMSFFLARRIEQT